MSSLSILNPPLDHLDAVELNYVAGLLGDLSFNGKQNHFIVQRNECYQPILNPKVIITDLQRSLQVAVTETFANTKVVECWYHSVNVSTYSL